MDLPQVRPMPLVRIPEPFNDEAWLYETKLDGSAFVWEEPRCDLDSDERLYGRHQQSLDGVE